MPTTKQIRIKKILIANRSEIARRIQATCKALDIQTVAIYTQEDKFSQYVHNTNEAYELTKSGPAGYLDQEEIIKIAKKSGSDAVHPGYGFLSENSKFAERVISSGLAWIGPTPENIKLLADKSKSQEVMVKSGIPIIPGKTFSSKNFYALGEAEQAAEEIGFPVLLKCAHGGGGKGMRLVRDKSEFEASWKLVVSESQNLFGSSTIIVEKQIENPRHVEVQIAGDGKNYVHIFERECSLQRRHQKIMEESPCNFIKKHTKEKLYKSAIAAAKAVNYQNIGTVEFLVDKNENFYFLEMNTRLQVEHSVTEMTTGIDLIALQIQLAQDNKLRYTQDNIKQMGHAIECRIYAEDEDFIPSTGTIKNFVLPNYPFLRIDSDVEEGSKITPFFDPMLLKLTTCGFSREISIKNMLATLKSTNIFGISTNISFLKKILLSDEFKTGEINTQSLENKKIIDNLVLKKAPEEKLTDEQVKKIIEAVKKDLMQKNKSKNTQTNAWKSQQWENLR